MFPYFELFGIRFSMMMVGIILSFIIFISTSVILTRRNHQDFLKLFYGLPVWIILSYVLGRWISYGLEVGSFLPQNIGEFLVMLSPQNYKFHLVGLILASWICFIVFFSSIKRTENRKIWADILFVALANSLIILGIFLTLGDIVIGKPTDGIFAIRTLVGDSNLTKFDSVYPIGLFISFGVLLVHIIISVLTIVFKKNGLGLRGFIGILLVLNICFPFWYYTRYGVFSLFGVSFDVNQYFSVFVLIYFIFISIRREQKRFY